MPPLDLRVRVSMVEDADEFDRLGRQSILDLNRSLASIGRPFASFRRVLDWGCGCGRVLRRVEPGPELHGCDIDGEAIAWLAENMPAVRAAQCDGLPPLAYPDGHFDLIINHSVMSHLNEVYQDAWLAELGRVLAADGVLVLTVHGAFSQEFWAHHLRQDDPERQRNIEQMYRAVDEHGIFFIDDDAWAGRFPKYYQNTLHAPWYIFEHWTRWFDILNYRPRGSIGLQDMIVLGHKQREVPARALPSQVRRAAASGDQG